jgi:hypothetical protein
VWINRLMNLNEAVYHGVTRIAPSGHMTETLFT